MDHIQFFKEICTTTRQNKVPPDYLECKLFSFSLADKAHHWLKSLLAGSFTTWEGCKSALLNHFYTISHFNLLRNKIPGFQQGPLENFYDAYELFNGYLRDCPCHGFTQANLLSTLDRGIDQTY